MAQRVLAGMTMSVDGFITGPNDRPGTGLTLEPAGVIESPFVTRLRYRCSVKE